MGEPLWDKLKAGGQLPSPPGVVLRLLELTRQPDVSGKQITETIALDPALSAKILRFVNSPLAGASRAVTSLQQAVALLGVRAVSTMALSLTIVSSEDNQQCRGFDQTQFAVQSAACGVAAKVLSTITKTGMPQEAFLAGLLSQIGRSALAGSLPEEYADVLAKAKQVPYSVPALEKEAFGETYLSVGARLLQSWNIPPSICEAIQSYRNLDENSEAPALANVLYVSELAAEAIVAGKKNGDPLDAALFTEAAQRCFSLNTEQCVQTINEITQAMTETANLLALPPAKTRSVEEIESEVRERLTELSIAMHLENQSMASQQEDLLRRATTDALTGVANRAAFDARMLLELERAVRYHTPFALLMVDVDRFKKFNDTYGHQAGDQVLRSVARLLDDNVRKVDYVARYGGEEFAIIAPGTPEEGIAVLAERLRIGVETLAVPWEGKGLNITLSIGAAVFTDIVDAASVEAIVRAADAQLYNAKCAGRNQVKIITNRAPVGVSV